MPASKTVFIRVINKIYPLAGRINDTNLCFIDCDDSGALFIEAQVHAQLSEKLSQSTAIEELNQYLPLEPYAHDADNIPLAIQISFFECGGMAIGVCISHKNEKMVTKRLVFNKEKLAALKELTSSAAIGSLVRDPTRVEANELAAFDHLCAFGNLFVTTSALLVSDKNQELHDLVWHLRTAFTKVNDEYIKNVQSGMPYLNTLSNEMKPLFEEDMGSCCWCGFPVYEVDYGWGKPVVVCTSAVPMNNVVILMSTRCGDGIEAWINMLEDEIAMLPEEILSLATDHLLSCP
ncbi:vinorine synthase-like [Coffea eugenioides]|uniref:vinorine synthase-like n=1 Tax=Coffea eugenioides TaxID=49369 RepID=UPI000F614202|nr:vinorine synthase-like [Coffea eugenioides]